MHHSINEAIFKKTKCINQRAFILTLRLNKMQTLIFREILLINFMRLLFPVCICGILPNSAVAGKPWVVFDEFDNVQGGYPADVLNRRALVHWTIEAEQRGCVGVSTRSVFGNSYQIRIQQYCPEVKIYIGSNLVKTVTKLDGHVGLPSIHVSARVESSSTPVATSYKLVYSDDFSTSGIGDWECREGEQDCTQPPRDEDLERLNGKTITIVGMPLQLNRKYLLASLGDSYASGEGMPNFCGIKRSATGHLVDSLLDTVVDVVDTPADIVNLIQDPGWSNLYDASQLSIALQPAEFVAREECIGMGASMKNRPIWNFEPDHRSGRAPSFLLAGRMHQQGVHGLKHLNLAKSGATTANLVQSGGQIDQLKALVGDRTLDALFISVGGNDAGFSKILKALVLVPDPVFDFGIDSLVVNNIQSLGSLRVKLDTVAQKIRSSGIKAKKIYFVSYPAGLFSKKIRPGIFGAGPEIVADVEGCGVFTPKPLGVVDDLIPTRIFGVTGNDARQIRVLGDRLNDSIKSFIQSQNGFRRFNKSWQFVGGISKRFDGHGYCSQNSMLVAWGRSCNCQGDSSGAVHPNAQGISLIVDSMVEAMSEDSPISPGTVGGVVVR
jgi:hypothetical protein